MSADRLLALVAIALAVTGVGLATWVVVWMRRVRRAQSALLSGGPVADLVEFAVGMQARQEHVERRADELGALVEQARADVGRALQRVGLQRFDAYDGAEGLQSTALALLDARGDGFVVRIRSEIERDLIRVVDKAVLIHCTMSVSFAAASG